MIYEKPQDVYLYFIRNQHILDNKMMCMAENEETRMSIWISSEDGDILFSVMADEDPVIDEVVSTSSPTAEYETEETYEMLLETYLGMEVPVTDEDNSDAISESEEYLDSIMVEMIESIVSGFTSEDELMEAAYGIKELVCDVLTKRYGFDIRRPMYLIDSSGRRSYEEYPYRKLNSDAGAETVFK